MIEITKIQIEHLQSLLGVGVESPRLSWQVTTDIPNWQQAGYEIHLMTADEYTGRILSDQSVLVDWPFAPLQSRQKNELRVRVWGQDGSKSDWSEAITIEAGLLQSSDWQAQFITPTWEEDLSISNPAPYFRQTFEAHNELASARLYVTALGVFEAQINGQIVGDHVLDPGWTVYDSRLRYQTFDVTQLIQPGKNGIGAIVGDGWCRGRLGFGEGKRNIYSDKLGLLAQLELTYTDGTVETIATNEKWQAATGSILKSSIYDGEHVDARLEPVGWTDPEFDDSAWESVTLIEKKLDILETPLGPPVRRISTVEPVGIFTSPSGKTLVDFGQNLVGRLKIQVKGEAGHTITFRHAEVLEEGELGVRPLRSAEATDHYTLRGGEIEVWEPKFTFHGFRYAEITNWSGELQPDAISAIVIHSDMDRTGRFECSNPQLNQLHENVVWSMRGNFLDVPTDCPQRDERMGWTGDIQVFAPSAAFLFQSCGFLQSWLADLAVEQKKSNGSVPHVVPDILGDGGAAAWGDAAVVVPWVLYQRFGDTQILEDQFASMTAWVDHVAAQAGESFLWDKGFQFGDWLDPAAPPDKPFMARTAKEIVATAYFAYSSDLVAKIATLLGRKEAQSQYTALAANVRNAFIREYVTQAGRLMNETETAYALAIMFDLLPTAEQRERAGNRLAELVRNSGYLIQTGFVGSPLICDALSATGHHRTAFRLLNQDECPSWLYPVSMGATTVWERWDSMLPDGSINSGEMTSFNHYALGAVVDWMHRIIGGLAPAEPGYRRLLIAPRPGGGLTHCHTDLITPYGEAACSWKIENGQIELSVKIPPNTSALVTVPGSELDPIEVGSGEWHWSADYTDPDTRGPYTVFDSAGEVMFNRTSRELVINTLKEVGAPAFLPNLLINNRAMPLIGALQLVPDTGAAIEKMNKVLATL